LGDSFANATIGTGDQNAFTQIFIPSKTAVALAG
jgi:hypothetical protein